MKFCIGITLVAVLFISDYASAQVPSCPCDTLELSNGTTGNDIVELLCPGGVPGQDTQFFVDQGGASLSSPNELYSLDGVPIDGAACGIAQVGGGANGSQLTPQEFEDCRESLILRCGRSTTSIPTISEWGMIAMAGVLGVIGLIVASRRRKAAA